MNKKIITWAVAALLTAPAVPLFAKTVHKHTTLTHSSKIHPKVMTATKKHRTTHHHKKHHTALTSSAKKHTTLSTSSKKHTMLSSSRAGRHLSHSTAILHSAKPAAMTHPRVLMNNQPTIDAMHT